jgi:BirA family biotin operon repressor/biotin-[acetyl-CoA-carboxylase] ligase
MQNSSRLDQKIITSEFSRRDNFKKKKKIDEKQSEIILDNSKSIRIITIDKIDSTNNEAKRYVKNICKNNHRNLQNKKDDKLFVFAADIQTKGRGRRGNDWFSANKQSLSVSFLTSVNDNIEDLPPITAAAALAVKNTFENFNLDTVIKWPNDIIVKSKKIAGILSELLLPQKNKAYLVIGCGLNLNNKRFIENINEKATSYYKEKGVEINKNIFLVELINNINYYINKYFSGEKKKIVEKWKNDMNIISKNAVLAHNGINYDVFIKDILDNGEIVAELEDGSIKKFQSYNTSFKYTNFDNN